MRYEWILDWADIIGGAGGAEDKVEEATSFLNEWSTWLVTLIGYVADFIKKIGAAFEK